MINSDVRRSFLDSSAESITLPEFAHLQKIHSFLLKELNQLTEDARSLRVFCPEGTDFTSALMGLCKLGLVQRFALDGPAKRFLLSRSFQREALDLTQ